MASPITTLADYSDENGNIILVLGEVEVRGPIKITFNGKNNHLIIQPGGVFSRLIVTFEGDRGKVDISHPYRAESHKLRMRLGYDCAIRIGPDCSETAEVYMTAAEGSSITVGSDVMMASRNEIRSTDAHSIVSVADGTRLNPSADIVIGNHVWLAMSAVVLPGCRIGDNSVIALHGVVTKDIPPNVVAAGVPARPIRQGITWTRPVTFRFPPPEEPGPPALT